MERMSAECCCDNCCAVTPELLQGLADFTAGRSVSSDWLFEPRHRNHVCHLAVCPVCEDCADG